MNNKHTRLASNRAKNKLKCLHKLRESDFYLEDNVWKLNFKDNVGITAFDYLENLENES
jgi:hypothetical protein|tara:strand:+ start:6049 stop:6225 length:177 start_codon:yes stop_codon:yes gene_type:complete